MKFTLKTWLTRVRRLPGLSVAMGTCGDVAGCCRDAAGCCGVVGGCWGEDATAGCWWWELANSPLCVLLAPVFNTLSV